MQAVVENRRTMALMALVPMAMMMAMVTPAFQNSPWQYKAWAVASQAPSKLEAALQQALPQLLPSDERPPPDPEELGLPQTVAASIDPGVATRYPEAIKAAATKFKGERLVMALAVNRAESGLRADAVAYNCSPQPCQRGSRDRGYWQINDHWHPEVSDQCALDPVCAAKEAYRISSSGKNWEAWSSYWGDPANQTGPGEGAFLQYVPEVRAALQLSVAT